MGHEWLHSYVTGDKVYCVYLAPDEATIQEHARLVGVPANRVSPSVGFSTRQARSERWLNLSTWIAFAISVSPSGLPRANTREMQALASAPLQ